MQNGMVTEPAKAAQYAGLRDRAVKLAKAAADGNAEEAKKLAATLTLKGDPSSNGAPQDLAELMELDELMQQFKPERGGGKELEKKLQFLASCRAPLTSAEIADAERVALQTAAIGQLTEHLRRRPTWGRRRKRIGCIGRRKWPYCHSMRRSWRPRQSRTRRRLSQR